MLWELINDIEGRVRFVSESPSDSPVGMMATSPTLQTLVVKETSRLGMTSAAILRTLPLNTLRTGDANSRLSFSNVSDGRR